MTTKYIAKKLGMTQLFDEEQGRNIVCTVLEVPQNIVLQTKSQETDGYCAIQIGAYDQKPNRCNKPQRVSFEKHKLTPKKIVVESRVLSAKEYKVGDELSFDLLKDWKYVDVTGVSKGKGFQGVMKLHGFKGGPGAHGSSFHRHAGSTGMRSTPGRCFPGGKRASRMGADKVKVENLEVVAFHPEKNLLVVKGAIPGARQGIVHICKALKKQS